MTEKIPEHIKDKIKQLVKELNYHAYHYYVLDAPVISDDEYDQSFRNLKELEERYHYILPDSPSRRIGAPAAAKFDKVTHREPMLSLDNAFSHDEVRDFDKRVKRLLKDNADLYYTVEPKYDGLAVELTYTNGIFHKASTRGDGYEGEDVTQNMKTLKAVPLVLESNSAPPEEIDIRGEVYMNIGEFEKLNREREQQGESLFANPRNAAAGSMRQLDPAITALRRLHIACYGIGAVRGAAFKSQMEFIIWLKSVRIPVPTAVRRVRGIDEVIRAIREIEEERKAFPFETDGAVIKVDDFELQRLLGAKTREPRWAIAYKFPAHQGTTRIRDIQASVGRTGVLTPFAIFEPVRIGGVTMSRSTLHNWDEIQRKDIRIGDTVVVERAGDVIPHLVMVIKDKRQGTERHFPIPERCPACSSKVVSETGEVAVRCINLNCPAQVQERITHFASRGAMDIEGLGEKNVELFYQNGLISHFIDVYRLKKDDLLRLPRFADKSVQNLIEAIEKSKRTVLARFLFALGILHVGEYAAKVLARHFRKLEDLYYVPQEQIKGIRQMGEKISASVADFFNNAQNIRTLDMLKQLGLEISNPDFAEPDFKEKVQTNQPLDGLTFVITGTLPQPRKDIEDMIERFGGHMASSISKSTSYLLVGGEPGSKLRKAQLLGVKTISHEDLLRLIHGHNHEK